MNVEKNENKAISLTVTEGLTVTVLPDSTHEFLIPTKDVASGYGVSPKTVYYHQSNNPDDFIEGKHFVKGSCITSTLSKNAQPHQVYYTKRGVVRLGFFIKSPQAKLFRDWAEDLIIHHMDEYAANLAGADKPAFVNAVLYEFDTRVRTKMVNNELHYKVRDISLLCKVTDTSVKMRKLKSLDNFVKITADFWDIEEWWCNRRGVAEFLMTVKNRNFIRLHDALFSPQLSLMTGGNA